MHGKPEVGTNIAHAPRLQLEGHGQIFNLNRHGPGLVGLWQAGAGLLAGNHVREQVNEPLIYLLSPLGRIGAELASALSPSRAPQRPSAAPLAGPTGGGQPWATGSRPFRVRRRGSPAGAACRRAAFAAPGQARTLA
jgi:hypothetical protein